MDLHYLQSHILQKPAARRIDGATRAMLHFDGANASTTITDSIPTPKTYTARGNAQISTAQWVFGGSSLLLDGTGDYVDTPDSADFNLAGSEFDIECRVRFNTLATDTWNASGARAFCGQWGASGNRGYGMGVELTGGTQKMFFGYTTGGVTPVVLNSSTITVATGIWYTFRYVRDNSGSDLIRFFQDGADVGTAGIDAVTVFNSSANFMVGTYNGTLSMMDGYMDEFIFDMNMGALRTKASYAVPVLPYVKAGGV